MTRLHHELRCISSNFDYYGYYMHKRLTGTKKNMTQLFKDDGTVTPVTIVQVIDGIEELTAVVGASIAVSGTSKGKGFAGAVKRYSFAGGPKTHGQSDRHRAVGSIGAGTDPGKVLKGKKMPGRMGSQTVTVKGLRVEQVDQDQKLVYIKGAVPGGPKSTVTLIFEVVQETEAQD